MEEMFTDFQFWIILLIVQLEVLEVKCRSEIERVNVDLLLPYASYPGPKHNHRHVRECQPEKYANTTHEEFNSQINKQFTLDYEVVEPRYFVQQFGDSWNQKWVYGHQFIISDPSRTVSVLEPLKQGGCEEQLRATVMESADQRKCLLAVNAGFFNVTDGRCIGNIMSDGYEAANSHGIQNAHFGIKKDNKLFFGYIGEDVDIASEFNQLVGGVIWLVRNGEKYIDVSKEAECPDAQSTGQLQGFIDVISSRIAVGHDAEGRLVIVHIEGQTWSRGVNLNEFADYLISLGVVNAINLDGGGSVTAVINGSLINYPGDDCTISNKTYKCERSVSTILCVHDIDCQPSDCNLHGDCFHGSCQCHDNWIGDDCSQLKCGEKNCSEQGICQPWGCECFSGWHGDDCTLPCQTGSFGVNCSLPCKCNSNVSCDPYDGHCRCPAGYHGYDCQQECAYGMFGEDCEAVCECDNDCGCDPPTGNCTISGIYPAFWEEGNCMGELKIINKTLVVITHTEMKSWIATVIILCVILTLSLGANIALTFSYFNSKTISVPVKTVRAKRSYRNPRHFERSPSISSRSDESSEDPSFVGHEQADFSFLEPVG